MKTPPLLTGAALIFWGWHTAHLGFAVPMAILLEGTRLLSWRFEIDDRDFNRIADFTSVFFLVLVVGAGWAAFHPQRGLQDRIAGTYLVPR